MGKKSTLIRPPAQQEETDFQTRHGWEREVSQDKPNYLQSRLGQAVIGGEQTFINFFRTRDYWIS